MKVRVKEPRLRYDYDGGMEISFKVPPGSQWTAKKQFDELRSMEDISLTAKKYREKRSIDANAYCWVLLDKLAEALDQSALEVYRELVREIAGVSVIQPIRNDALERWKAVWCSRGDGWQCEELGPSKHEGYTNVKSYWGSSLYDTKQMSRLIKLIIAECEQFGIETKTPQEIDALMREWEYGKKHSAK